MTSQYHEAAVVELKHLYTLRNEAQIVEFLDTYPDLYVFLREAYPIVQRYFPAENLALEMTFDPEEDYPMLFLDVETTKEVEEALAMLNQFDKEWWLERPYAIRSKLCIDVDFV